VPFTFCSPRCAAVSEDAYKIRIRIDDEPANLDILDTAGQVGEQHWVHGRLQRAGTEITPQQRAGLSSE